MDRVARDPSAVPTTRCDARVCTPGPVAEVVQANRGVSPMSVKPAGVVCDGYRVIFLSGQALSAGMVGAVTSSVAGWSAALVMGRMRQRAKTSRPR